MADGFITTFSCLQEADGLFTLNITIILCALPHVCVTVNKRVWNSSESLNTLNMELWLAIRNESTKIYIKIWINTLTEKCYYLCTECHRWLEHKSVLELLHSHDVTMVTPPSKQKNLITLHPVCTFKRKGSHLLNLNDKTVI
jgi:hypothetical protein